MHHLTLRVAWHDRAWDGAVCDHPADNAFCLCLDRVREGRDDPYEQSVAGLHWADLNGDPSAVPAGGWGLHERPGVDA